MNVHTNTLIIVNIIIKRNAQTHARYATIWLKTYVFLLLLKMTKNPHHDALILHITRLYQLISHIVPKYARQLIFHAQTLKQTVPMIAQFY